MPEIESFPHGGEHLDNDSRQAEIVIGLIALFAIFAAFAIAFTIGAF